MIAASFELQVWITESSDFRITAYMSGYLYPPGNILGAASALMLISGFNLASQIVGICLFEHGLFHGSLPVNLSAFRTQHGTVATKVFPFESCITKFAGDQFSLQPFDEIIPEIQQFLHPETNVILPYLVAESN